MRLAFAIALLSTVNAHAGDFDWKIPPLRRGLGWADEHPPREWSVDAVIGFGAQQPGDSNEYFSPEHIDTTSFAVSGQFALGRGRTVWLHLPVVEGRISPTVGGKERTVATLGNLEVEADWLTRIADDQGVRIGGAIAVPTIIEKDALSFGATPNDSRNILHAAAQARGHESDDLLEPGDFAFTARGGFLWRPGAFRVEPFVKAVLLVDPSAVPVHRLVGEFLGGVQARVLFGDHVSAGVRLWGIVAVADAANPDPKSVWAPVGSSYTQSFVSAGDDARTSLVVAEDVRVHLGRVEAGVGVVLPLAGALARTQVWGLSATLALVL